MADMQSQLDFSMRVAKRVYIELLQIEHSNPWRTRLQVVLCDLRDLIAGVDGRSEQDVQEDFERAAANIKQVTAQMDEIKATAEIRTAQLGTGCRDGGMTNEELARSIDRASKDASWANLATDAVTAELHREHLKALLEVQRQRARTQIQPKSKYLS